MNVKSEFIIKSSRVSQRKITTQDAEFIFKLVNTEGWLQFVGDRNVRNAHDAKSFIQTWALNRYENFGYGPYLVQLDSSSENIGICGLFKREYLEYPDLGFALLPEYNGKGLAREASEAVIQYAFETLNIPKLYAITAPTNKKSAQLLERLGFTEVKSPIGSTDRTFELNH
ncbi:GNAT family N-acetyltransferase [Fulvivirga lutimaris]|uniref:GNAT family N-acetyltransferase n=1 Tax=Fulvivirga lutimaris TaxID=1819566 RepID=UPI0012BBFF03|nr:GNAT family N-acetyltransferase [Fulvivirga lutimaris]MTI40491.1 N-acetyltransferase [Fulvivirga lutimaris]